MFKKILLLLFVLSFSVLIFALDDQGNPNDPNVNERANACYEDGSMAGKCNMDWEWEAGWYLIRFEFGLISREEFPPRFQHLLPALPVENRTGNGGTVPTATFTPGKNCQYRGSAEYVDFGTGNYLPIGSPIYMDANCANFSRNNSHAQVYTSAGLADADAICKAHNPLTSADPLWIIGNVYICI
jgi:hypothetical protein